MLFIEAAAKDECDEATDGEGWTPSKPESGRRGGVGGIVLGMVLPCGLNAPGRRFCTCSEVVTGIA